MTTRALVLGGGGPVGRAWEAGIVASLAEGGADVTKPDLIVGTSAGASMGALLSNGRSPDEIYREHSVTEARPSPGVQPDGQALIKIFQRWSSTPEPDDALCAEIGALALAAPTPPEEEWLGVFARRLAGCDWPDDVRLLITTVDAESGKLAVWERGCGVPIARAVTASCTVPGMRSPVTINGRRYIDGGVRSTSNARLAEAFERVLLIAPMGPQANGIGPISMQQVESETAALRASGSAVEVIMPDAASLDLMGPNLMDFTRGPQAAEGGLAQGREAAARVKELWAGT
jgi:NTE family protein